MPSLNLKVVGKFFSENKLWDKPFRDFSESDIELLADAIMNSLEDFGACWEPPYISMSGCLLIPWNAPKKYRWWQGGQSVMETLNELGASEEVKAKYSQPEGALKNET